MTRMIFIENGLRKSMHSFPIIVPGSHGPDKMSIKIATQAFSYYCGIYSPEYHSELVAPDNRDRLPAASISEPAASVAQLLDTCTLARFTGPGFDAPFSAAAPLFS